MKVLIVDDSSVMRRVLMRELQKLGLADSDISEAADGLEAVQMSSENQYDAIFMDWNMPNMLGIDAVKEIRSRGNKTPIMMITTEGEKTNVVLAIQAGANNYLVKPFNYDDFRQKFQSLVGAASPN
ncbi:MAG: response regulator [Vampirovibrionales bacterium]|nr:response regulator [Vampirovibrionales bacterium]